MKWEHWHFWAIGAGTATIIGFVSGLLLGLVVGSIPIRSDLDRVRHELHYAQELIDMDVVDLYGQVNELRRDKAELRLELVKQMTSADRDPADGHR